MSTTFHLFRDDVRRLRWWLLAWGLFWAVMLARSGQHQAEPVELGAVITSLASHWFQPELVVKGVHAALLALLVAQLILPHGPEDPRLFWRTRPIAAREVLRAKALFIGLFLTALPVGAEVVFWLGWLPVREALAFVPAMLGERLAWSAGMTLLVVLGERDARRYQLAVVWLLGLGLVWTYAFDQFLYAHWETTGEESILPGLVAEGGWRQLWTFFTKGPNRSVAGPDWLTWIPAVVLGVGGWVVVGCRYLTQGWRATRIVGLLALLVALVAGHVGVDVERRAQRKPFYERNEAVWKHLPMNAQAAALPVQLTRVANLGADTNSAQAYVVDFGAGKVKPVWVKPVWTIAQPPPGTLALARLIELAPAAPPKPGVDADAPLWAGAYGMIFSVLAATNELRAALPELAGQHLHSDVPADYGRSLLNPKVAAELERTPQAVLATFQVALIEARTVVTVPLQLGRSGQAGKMGLRVQTGPDLWHPQIVRHLVAQGPSRGYEEPSFRHHAEPDLLLFRNSATQEAFTMGWDEVGNLGFFANHTTATLLSPSRRHSIFVWDRPLSGVATDNSRRFTEAWLDQAEVLGVRLTLVGWSQRTVRLENFQLEASER